MVCRYTRLVFLISVSALSATGAMRGREAGARVQHPKLSAYWRTTCAALDDGTVRCWGANEQAQTGNGSATPSEELPLSPAGNINGVLAVAAGRDHTCVLALGGALGSTVRCWGDNEYGQLGDGTTTDRTAALIVPNLSNVISIAAGDNHTCALIVDGTIRCWGEGTLGELGNGGTTSQSSPVQVQGISGAVAITAGASHTCAVIAGGSARCWGWNFFGQIGDGTNTTRPAPASVSGLNGVVTISAGTIHTCALLVDGTVRCWGAGNGRLGDGTTATRLTPVAVAQLSGAVHIDTGAEHTCAVLANGRIRCWGSNGGGRLGDGTTAQRLDGSAEVLGVSNAVEVAAGENHTCALDGAGAVRCWGNNSLGQLGNGTNLSSLTATTVSGVSGNIGARGIVAGEAFTCARRGTGAAACWGWDANGRLGNGAGELSGPDPGAVSSLSNAVMLAAGFRYACAVSASGVLRCWGRNQEGQLGAGDTIDRETPVGGAGLVNVVAVAAASTHTCALLADGTIFCWGENGSGQLGNGTTTPSLAAVQVQGLSGATALAAGGSYTCAVIADGTVRCWGSGRQLGAGDSQPNSPVPLTVPALNNTVAITAGISHTCALAADGSVRCWGSNNSGQLGNTTTESRTIPDLVSGLTDAVAVSAGYEHTCAVRASGRASCWGRNLNGELAAADTANHTSPTPVIRSFTTTNRGNTIANPLVTVTGITTARGNFDGIHTCAVQANGKPQCWGENGLGQVGTNDSPRQFRPVAVPSFTANVSPAASLSSNGRIATVTALVNCAVGGHAQIFVSLTQGAANGAGVASEACTGGLAQVPIVVPAHGREGFQAGGGTASLEAIIREDGRVIDHPRWTRQVTLAPQ